MQDDIGPLPLIFLDIHGVMTNKSSEAAFGHGTFDPVSAELLRQLVKEIGARIVITSNARYGLTIEELRGYMREQAGKKLSHRTISAVAYRDDPRGELINEWRGLNGHTGPYVVLDNNPVAGHGALFILVDPDHGFKLAEKNEAAKLLGVK